IETRFSDIYSYNGLPNRLKGGYGLLPVSTNVLECSNSWDHGRWERQLNLNQIIEKMKKSGNTLIAECRQAPFGGASLVLAGSTVIYRSVWNTFSQKAKDSLLSKVGIYPPREATLRKLPEVLSTGKIRF
ncbi:hypothetical protein PFISCL1PPCAC_15699, partial [Pristionchus fissidentatus]